MNTRFYDAIPDHWKRILAKPTIPCMAYTRQPGDIDGFSGSELLYPKMHAWLQSAYELLGDGKKGLEGRNWKQFPYLENSQNRFRTWAPYQMFESNREIKNPEWTGADPTEGDVWFHQDPNKGVDRYIATYKRAIWGTKYSYLLYRTVSEKLNIHYSENGSGPGSFEAGLIRTSAPYYTDIEQAYFSYFNEYLAVPCLSIKEV
jgi:hypothetical protein